MILSRGAEIGQEDKIIVVEAAGVVLFHSL
jgi:hypothetical protein